jgi:FixJ family two-component response regulator
MPGTGGRDLATQLVAQRPGLKVLYMSGYTADVLGRQGILDEGLDMIEKPFTPDALGRKAREVLGRGDTRPQSSAPSKN